MSYRVPPGPLPSGRFWMAPDEEVFLVTDPTHELALEEVIYEWLSIQKTPFTEEWRRCRDESFRRRGVMALGDFFRCGWLRFSVEKRAFPGVVPTLNLEGEGTDLMLHSRALYQMAKDERLVRIVLDVWRDGVLWKVFTFPVDELLRDWF